MTKRTIKHEFTELDSRYLHIDNGGIHVALNRREIDGSEDLVLIIESSYFGYPAVETIVPLVVHDKTVSVPDFLMEVGTMFTQYAKRMKLQVDN